MKNDDERNLSKSKQRLEFIKKMPPLRHKPDDEFSIDKSEVLAWISQNPNAAYYIFDLVKRETEFRKPFIVFNSETRTWQGVEYSDD